MLINQQHLRYLKYLKIRLYQKYQMFYFDPRHLRHRHYLRNH